MLGEITATKIDRETIVIPMCKFFNPLWGCNCEKDRQGTLKCHKENKECPDYEPSIYKRSYENTT